MVIIKDYISMQFFFFTSKQFDFEEKIKPEPKNKDEEEKINFCRNSPRRKICQRQPKKKIMAEKKPEQLNSSRSI